jgi:hypothetical protein
MSTGRGHTYQWCYTHRHHMPNTSWVQVEDTHLTHIDHVSHIIWVYTHTYYSIDHCHISLYSSSSHSYNNIISCAHIIFPYHTHTTCISSYSPPSSSSSISRISHNITHITHHTHTYYTHHTPHTYHSHHTHTHISHSSHTHTGCWMCVNCMRRWRYLMSYLMSLNPWRIFRCACVRERVCVCVWDDVCLCVREIMCLREREREYVCVYSFYLFFAETAKHLFEKRNCGTAQQKRIR